MTIAQGVDKQLRYKKETNWGELAGPTGGQLLRRVDSTFSLKKDTYESKEISTHMQVSDMRHGIRKIDGAKIDGELSLSTWKDFFAAALRGAWAAGATTGALSDVTAATTAPQFTRGSGSFITDGLKVGDVVRWSGFTATENNGVNYRILALTDTEMTVDGAVTAEAAGSSVTCTVPGSKLIAPTSEQTSDSFTIEEWYSDIAQSEAFVGCRVTSIAISLPPTGMATISIGFIGKDMVAGTAEYFISPTAETTTQIMAAVNGNLRVAGADVAIVTGLDFNINCNAKDGEPVIGSNSIPLISQGRVTVTGQFTVYFEDGSFRDKFSAEEELSINAKLDADSTAGTECMVFNLGRVKLGGSDKDDGEKGIIQTVPFTALLNTSGGDSTAEDYTTISIQDTTVS